MTTPPPERPQRPIIDKLRKMKQKVDEFIIHFFAKGEFRASFYYLFLSKQFRREHRAVLLGRLEHEKSLTQIGESSALLRRNIHRLEKGLIMQPRRPVFAQDYILETTQQYFNCVKSGSMCESELRWATHVLSAYFDAVTATPIVSKARNQFDAALNNSNHGCEQEQPTNSPYPHKELPQPSVSFEQLHNLFIRRRSVRWFLPKKVELATIEAAIDVASLAPSACNRQPYKYHVETQPEQAVKIAECAMGTAGFSANIQAILVVLGDLSAYKSERDRHVIYIDASLASMQLMLAMETMGLSSCPINWPDITNNERKLAKLLDLEYHERPVMLIAVGYADPDGGIPYSQKKTSHLLIRNKYEN